jgi:hypothetical protein
MVTIERIKSMLELCSTENTLLPPTTLCNEGWMLRLVLDWFYSHRDRDHYLSFPINGKWYSEALLPSAFLPRYRGDRHAESRTHADAVIGHVAIGRNSDWDLTLQPDGTVLKVIEAKMFSNLSPGTTHAKYYHQAARNVACIAEVLRRANRYPSDAQSLAFYVIAPKAQIDEGVFSELMTHNSIRGTVERRVNEYEEPKNDWYQGWFLPTMERIDIRTISWEEIVSKIVEVDSSFGRDIEGFYELCRKFNRLKSEKEGF